MRWSYPQMTESGKSKCGTVLECPDLVKAVVTKHTAEGSTIRPTAMADIESTTPRTGPWREGEEIPEKHWMYGLAKKFFFNDFGFYRGQEKKKGANDPTPATWSTEPIRCCGCLNNG